MPKSIFSINRFALSPQCCVLSPGSLNAMKTRAHKIKDRGHDVLFSIRDTNLTHYALTAIDGTIINPLAFSSASR
jgi:hypothetical protein